MPFCEVGSWVGGALAGRRHLIYAHASRWQFTDYNSSAITICHRRCDSPHRHIENKLSRKNKISSPFDDVIGVSVTLQACCTNRSKRRRSVKSGPRAACSSIFGVEPQIDLVPVTERDLEKRRIFSKFR